MEEGAVSQEMRVAGVSGRSPPSRPPEWAQPCGTSVPVRPVSSAPGEPSLQHIPLSRLPGRRRRPRPRPGGVASGRSPESPVPPPRASAVILVPLAQPQGCGVFPKPKRLC